MVKHITRPIFIILAVLCSITISAATLRSKAFVPAIKIYIPLGFDSNDSVEMVVWGRLPSSCYHTPTTVSHVTGDKILIELSASTKITEGQDCHLSEIDFLETVKLGSLNALDYKVSVNQGTPFQLFSELSIGEASSTAVDDFSYANVDFIEHDVIMDLYYLVGTHDSDCSELDEIKIVSNNKDVYAILPIMKKASGECTGKPKKFKYAFGLPLDLKEEMLLLHVRTENGGSVNKVIKNIQ